MPPVVAEALVQVGMLAVLQVLGVLGVEMVELGNQHFLLLLLKEAEAFRQKANWPTLLHRHDLALRHQSYSLLRHSNLPTLSRAAKLFAPPTCSGRPAQFYL